MCEKNLETREWTVHVAKTAKNLARRGEARDDTREKITDGQAALSSPPQLLLATPWTITYVDSIGLCLEHAFNSSL
jgi:hypothetical protein